MTEGRPKPTRRIACQQVLLQDSSVFSIQWMLFPSEYSETLTPLHMLDRYLHYIRIFTLSLVRPFRTTGRIEFRLLGTGISLISFNGPLCSDDGKSSMATLFISGGVLLQRDHCRRGELSFITRPARSGLKAVLQLSGYCPALLGGQAPSRWRRFLYRITQAYLHRAVTVRFLSQLCRDLEEISPRIRVVRVKVRKGRET